MKKKFTTLLILVLATTNKLDMQAGGVPQEQALPTALGAPQNQTQIEADIQAIVAAYATAAARRAEQAQIEATYQPQPPTQPLERTNASSPNVLDAHDPEIAHLIAAFNAQRQAQQDLLSGDSCARVRPFHPQRDPEL